jgi:tetratricopeptide (TPR) repeat protein
MKSSAVVILLALVSVLAACGFNSAERNRAGNAQLRAGEYEAALAAYQAAQVNRPDDPIAYYNAAAALVGLERLDQAVASLELAIQHGDRSLTQRAYFNLGNVFFDARLYAEAADAYQQALLIDPDDEDARYNYELALLRYVPPTPTALEQQTNPESGETDPDVTPTNQPGGLTGPTPTPPQEEGPPDLTASPVVGEVSGQEDSATPVPQSQGEMTLEQAERILDSIRDDQQALREFLQESAESGEPSEKDW